MPDSIPTAGPGMVSIDTGTPIVFAEPERTPPDGTTPRVPERCHDEAPGPLGTGLYCGRLAGHDGDHGHGIYKWASTVPVTAEGLRERLIDALLNAWKLPQATRSRITREAAGRDVDTILAALAGDPGDLPARMAEAIGRVVYIEPALRGEVTAAALSVRLEHAAHLAARVADAERRAEHAENEHQVTQERLAEAERRLDQLRAYARWCNDRSVEPKERDIRELADGTHRDCVCATRLTEAENPDGGK